MIIFRKSAHARATTKFLSLSQQVNRVVIWTLSEVRISYLIKSTYFIFLSRSLYYTFRDEYQLDDPLTRGENITLVSSDLPNTTNASVSEGKTMENVNAGNNFEMSVSKNFSRLYYVGQYRSS